MAPETLNGLVQELLAYGSADWLHFAEVNRIVALRTGQETDVAALEDTVAVLRHLLSEGLAVVGELPVAGSNFHMWPGTTDGLIQRIRSAADSLIESGRAIKMGDVCWVAITPSGRGAR